MKTIGTVLNKKQRDIMKGKGTVFTACDIKKLFEQKKFKQVKIGSKTLCRASDTRPCPYLLTGNCGHCLLFDDYLMNYKRCYQCKEAFGKQVIMTGQV